MLPTVTAPGRRVNAGGLEPACGHRRRGHRAGPGRHRHRRRRRRVHRSCKQVGRRWRGLCPFHAEKTAVVLGQRRATASTTASAARRRGDAITFVREIEHLDFVEAVERLAAKAGITLALRPSRDEGKDRAERKRLIERHGAGRRLVPRAPAHRRPTPAPARGYLREPRASTATTVRALPHRLGARRLGRSSCQALKLPDDDLVDDRPRLQEPPRPGHRTPSGAGSCSRSSTPTATPVAFGGRILPGAEGPKYKNSPETPIYSKSRVLYGLNWAKADIVGRRRGHRLRGLHRRHRLRPRRHPPGRRHLRHRPHRGPRAAAEPLRQPHRAGLRRRRRRPGRADRFYEWEQRYELDVVRRRPAPGRRPRRRWRRIDPTELVAGRSASAKPFLAFRLDRVLDGGRPRLGRGPGPGGRGGARGRRRAPNDLVRDQYLMQRRRPLPDRRRPAPQRVATGDVRKPAPPEPVRRRRDEPDRWRLPQRRPRPDEHPVATSRPGSATSPSRGRGGRAHAPATTATRRPGRSRDDSPAVEALRLAVDRPEDGGRLARRVPVRASRCTLETYRALVAAATMPRGHRVVAARRRRRLSRLLGRGAASTTRWTRVARCRSGRTGRRMLAIERSSPDADLEVLTRLAGLVGRVATHR